MRLSAANIASVPSSSLRKTLSVISSSSRDGLHSGLGDRIGDDRRQFLVGELQRRDVDRAADILRPCRKVATRGAQTPTRRSGRSTRHPRRCRRTCRARSSRAWDASSAAVPRIRRSARSRSPRPAGRTTAGRPARWRCAAPFRPRLERVPRRAGSRRRNDGVRGRRPSPHRGPDPHCGSGRRLSVPSSGESAIPIEAPIMMLCPSME